ncbi:hypothetical protein BHE74_00050364, partial [Ensete ventricosum]
RRTGVIWSLRSYPPPVAASEHFVFPADEANHVAPYIHVGTPLVNVDIFRARTNPSASPRGVDAMGEIPGFLRGCASTTTAASVHVTLTRASHPTPFTLIGPHSLPPSIHVSRYSSTWTLEIFCAGWGALTALSFAITCGGGWSTETDGGRLSRRRRGIASHEPEAGGGGGGSTPTDIRSWHTCRPAAAPLLSTWLWGKGWAAAPDREAMLGLKRKGHVFGQVGKNKRKPTPGGGLQGI